MSTFFGGEQFVNSVTLRAQGSISAGTKYTTPSGRYSLVTLMKWDSISTTSFRVLYSNGNSNIIPITNGVENQIQFTLDSSDALEFTGSVTGNYNLLIQEFQKP